MLPKAAGKFGFGCMRLPTLSDKSVDVDEMKKMVDEFLAAGFNYFDTARTYHEGRSEQALKTCLTSRYPRDKYVIADKLSSSCFQTEEDIRPFFISQLAALGVSYIDFYLLHAQSRRNYPKYCKTRAYETVQELKKEGLVKYVGLSFHDTPEYLEKILTERPEVDFVQIQFNYLDYDNPDVQSKEVYDVCVRHNKPIIVMEPVRGGALAKLPKEAKELIRDLNDRTDAAMALRFAASFPDIYTVLSGVSNLGQMRDNIRTMKDFRPLTEQEKEKLYRVAELIIRLKTIPCTGCAYCSQCPQGIKIPEIIACLNKYRVYKDSDAFFDFQRLIADGGLPSTCLQCGLCESVCPQRLPIIELLKEARATFEK